jgi:hypothetical protein
MPTGIAQSLTPPPRIEPSMAGVIGHFGPSFLGLRGGTLSPIQHKALEAIGRCRTEALGGHVVKCEKCHVVDYAYHSCRHRSCPRCMAEESEEWLTARRGELLPVPYYHVVFTVHSDLNWTVLNHAKVLYPMLMQGASRTILEVASRAENLGGKVGVMATLHTSSETLMYHPHVHCLVPAGFVDKDGVWHSAEGRRLGTPGELARVFRKKVKSMLKSALKRLGHPAPEVPAEAFGSEWKVHLEPAKDMAEVQLGYLARSLHRGPILNQRILSVTNKEVVFRYRPKDRTKSRTMSLPGHEFLRRFLLHIWPDRIHKVCYSGLWGRGSLPQLKAIRAQLLSAKPTESSAEVVASPADIPAEPVGACWLKCPHCNGQRVIIASFRRGQKAPPLQLLLTSLTAPDSRPSEAPS